MYFHFYSNQAPYPMGIGGNFLGGEATGGVKLTTHLYLVPRSRMVELFLHFLIFLHGIVLK
jgi:hypothetical protein